MLSVIVPAYNAVRTLGHCLDSIIVQTYSDIELIVVDDGSQDDTPAICDGYASRDARVRVIHKTNAGVGAARNSGLDIACGEYVAFVDADDTVKPDYLSNLMLHTGDGIDLVISNASVCRDGNWKDEKYTPVIVRGNDFDGIFSNNVLHTSPWSKLYRKSVIDRCRLRFPQDMSIGEDAVFLLTFMTESAGVVVSEDSDYLYKADVTGTLTKKLYPYEKEIGISSKIDATVDRLIEEKGMKSAKAMHNLNLIKSLYRERVLDSIYFCENMRHKDRMKAIRSLQTDNLRVFPFSQFGLRAGLLSHLLKWRQLWLYDKVRTYAARHR